MEKINNLFQNKLFLFLLVLGGFVFVGLLSILLDFSFLFAFGSAFIILSIILFAHSPLFLLFLLVVTRMSLDYSSNFIYFQITKNISVSLSQFTGIAIAILGLLILMLRKKELKKFPLWSPFLIILFWGMATLFYSISPKDSFQELVRIFDLFALSVLAFISVKNISDLKKLFLAIFVSSIIPIALAVYQLIFGIGFQDEMVSIPRIYGTFSHPNVLSIYLFLIISLAVLYAFVFAKNEKDRLLTGLFILGNIILLYLTYTRIAWVALLFFVGVIGIMRFRKLLLPLIFIPIALFVFSTQFQERIEETLNPSVDSSITWRKLLWKDTVSKTLDDGNMLTGYGINTFPLVSESARGIALGSNDSHNDFVKFFVEGGLLGLGIFIIYLGRIIFILWRQKKSAAADKKLTLIFEFLLLIFLALVISSLSDNIFKNTPVQWIFWIMLGASLALVKKRKSISA